jgi:hypothetical protein
MNSLESREHDPDQKLARTDRRHARLAVGNQWLWRCSDHGHKSKMLSRSRNQRLRHLRVDVWESTHSGNVSLAFYVSS